MSRRHEIQDATGRIEYISGRGTVQAWGSTPPSNGVTGFAPGCIWHNIAGGVGSCFYVNTGTFTSAQWLNLDGLGGAAQEANVPVTTAGNTTLSALALINRVITRTGPTAAFTDTTDTMANITAALAAVPPGTSWEVRIANQTAFPETIAAGTGVTLAGETVVPPLSLGLFLFTYIGPGAVTLLGLAAQPLTTLPLPKQTALNTVGAGTITAAGIVGGVTLRGGAQGGTAFTDTTDTAANIIAALPNAQIGQPFYWTYQNQTNAQATLANGTGVTVSGITAVPPGMWAEYLATYTGAGAVTLVGITMGPNADLTETQFVSIATGNGTLAAGNMEGAWDCTLATSGATALTTRTAAQLFAQVPNAQVNMSYRLRVYNTNAGTLTLTAGTGVTINGTATIASNVWRDYYVTFTSATAVTMQNLGSGQAN